MTALTMITLPAVALSALLSLAAAPARADCHWAWHCDQAGACGFVPFCDSPDDKPPPLQGVRPGGERKPLALPDAAHPRRKPLPGYTPVNPPPPGVAPVSPAAPRPDQKKPAQGAGEVQN